MSNNKQLTEPMVVSQTASTSTAEGIYVQHLKNKMKMSNNKQSSVEWLIDKLIEHQIIKVGQTTYGGKVNYKHKILLEQAKTMHKDEIKDAYWNGTDNDKTKNEILLEAEEFYNEWYNETNLGKE